MPRALNTVPFPPPTRGSNVGIVETAIPEGFIWKSQNMIDRFGQFRTRQGLSRLIPTPMNSRCTGGILFTDNVGQRTLIAANLTGLFRPTAAAWQDMTGLPAPLHATPEFGTRFAVFSLADARTLISVNNVDTPRFWDGVSPTFAELGGTPPNAARDIDVCFNRVIMYNVEEAGIRASARARISGFNNPQSWPGGLVIDTTDTGDDGVAVRTLTRSTCLLYNTDSIWILSGQAGIFPFTLDILAPAQPGPVSAAAVVKCRGTHYYLGRDFRIYSVSQNGVQNLSEQTVDKILQARVNIAASGLTVGLYRPADQTVWWFFTDSTLTDPDQAVSLNINSGAIHFHNFRIALSAAWPGANLPTITWNDLLPFTWDNIADTYPTWDSFGGSLAAGEFIGAVNGFAYRSSYDIPDDGEPIPMVWEFPPKLQSGLRNQNEFDSIESTFETPPASPDPVFVDIGVTETLAEAEGPTYTNVGSHDTRISFAQVLSWSGPAPLRGRFMNVRYRCTSLQPVKFKGAIAYITAEERES